MTACTSGLDISRPMVFDVECPSMLKMYLNITQTKIPFTILILPDNSSKAIYSFDAPNNSDSTTRWR